MNNIKLGCTAKDAVTGIAGLVINRTEFLNGNVQFSIQPPSTEKDTYPDPISIDYHLLDVIDSGVSDRVIPSAYAVPISLGSEVTCIITGTRGIATMKTHYLNGCAAFLVTQKQNKDGIVKEEWIDQYKLKITGKGVTEKYVKPEVQNNKPSGGPSMKGIPRS